MSLRIAYVIEGEEVKEDVERRLEMILNSMDEESLRTLSKIEVEVKLDDLPEWMFAETSTGDLRHFTITLNGVRYPEAEGEERLWRIAHELGHVVHILIELERGRVAPPRRVVILSGDEADANALAMLWGFKPPRTVVEGEVEDAYREALRRGIEERNLLRYISFRSGFDLSIVEDALRRIRGLDSP